MIAVIDKELVDFVYDNYPVIQGQVTKEQVENLLTIYDRQVIVVKDKEVIKGVGFYFKLSNRTLKEVRNKTLDIGNPTNAVYCLKDNGRNIHFVLLVAKKVSVILKGLKEVIRREIPITVSWFSPDMTQFFIRRL